MRVFVTAVGMVSPLAVGAEASFRALIRGERALRPVTLFDVGASRSRIAAEILDLERNAPIHVIPRAISRVEHIAIVAAREAISAAGLSKNAIVDLVSSGVQGGMFETELTLVDMHRGRRAREPNHDLAMHPVSATAERLREFVFPFRRLHTVSSACSGGASAITLAETWIRSGQTHCVLAGGADALCRFTFSGFHLLASLDPEPCKPFDKARAGLNLGEGAAYLLLESEAEVRRRQVQPLAELVSTALGAEGKHIIQPEENGETLERLLRLSLHRAGLSAADIDYLNAHGTATRQSDAMESNVYRRVFQDTRHRLPVSTCKGQWGHALGAAAAMEAAVTVLALHHGQVPPTGGLLDPDPACDLLHVRGHGYEEKVRAAASVSAGFGGATAVLCFSRPYAFESPRQSSSKKMLVISSGVTLGPLGFGLAEPSLEYLEEGHSPKNGPSSVPLESLEADKIRRFDNAAVRLVLLAKAVHDAAGGDVFSASRDRVGIAAGLAFRGADVGASFLAPVLQANFRTGRPLDFPGLLSSSPTSQASIYLSLRGPSLTLIDGEASTAAALTTALDMVEADHADAMVVAGLSEYDDLTRVSLGPSCLSGVDWTGTYTDGAGALWLECAEICHARGATPLARIVARQSDDGALLQLDRITADVARALVVVPRNDARFARALEGSAWQNVRQVDISQRAGTHEALFAIAMVSAVYAIASKVADEVLLIDVAAGRFEAFVLTAC